MQIALKSVRVAPFSDIHKPSKYQANDPSYSCKFIIEPTSDNVAKLDAAMLEVANEKWGDKGAAVLKTLIKDGKVFFSKDERTDKNGDPVDGFEGQYYISTKNAADRAPGAYNKRGEELLVDDHTFYAGCYAHVSLDLWAQDHQNYGRRINCNLRLIKFAKDGPLLAGGASAAGLHELAGLDDNDADDFV